MSVAVPVADPRRRTFADPRDINSALNQPRYRPGVESDASGLPIQERDYSLSRSPGPFAVRIGNDGQRIIIGEEWIGPDDPDLGGLEGCTPTAPGLVALADGNAMPVGGEMSMTVADIVAQAGEDGSLGTAFRAIILALVPPPGTSGDPAIVYHAVLLSGSPALEVWQEFTPFVPAAYQEWLILPIACVALRDIGGWRVTDVFWSREEPVSTVGGSSTSGGGNVALVSMGAPYTAPYYYGELYVSSEPIFIRLPQVQVHPIDPIVSWVDLPPLLGILSADTVLVGDITYAVYDAVGLLVVI